MLYLYTTDCQEQVPTTGEILEDSLKDQTGTQLKLKLELKQKWSEKMKEARTIKTVIMTGGIMCVDRYTVAR